MCVSNYFLEMFVLLSRGHTLKYIDPDCKGGLDPGTGNLLSVSMDTRKLTR